MTQTTYRLYDDTNGDGGELHLIGDAEAASPEGAVRAYFNGAKVPPARLVVIPRRSVHQLTAAVETQTRLRFQ